MDQARSSGPLAKSTPGTRSLRWRIGVALATVAAVTGIAAEGVAGQGDPSASPEQVKFFETEVRPLLAASCLKCHGPDKQKGGLRLDSKAAILTGGESGPAVVPGKPAESLLVEAINYEGPEMPPKGKLGAPQRETLTKWIAMGLPWPANDPGASASATPTQAAKSKITDEDRAFWSFQPLRRPDVPSTNDGGWARNAVDRFIFARLHAEGLTPAPQEDREILIRRLTFDIWGLPPTPAEVDAFLADKGPNAYETLVDRLLASPRYGERWGRHWLDLVRYAESDGYRADGYRPDAWRYRDYVIKAFNEDRPYNRFVTEQLAGDELDPSDPELKVAVGYYRLGTYEYNQRDVPAQWSAIVNDITDVTGDVFLGLGMGCARCHDHKFDPILQKDYYRLQAFFSPILPRNDLNLATPREWPAYQEKLAAWEAKTAETRAAIAALERPYREGVAKMAIDRFPAEMQALINKPQAERTPSEEQLVALAYRQVTHEYDLIADKMKKSKDKDAWTALQKQLAEQGRDRPTPPAAVLTATDVGPLAPPTMIPGDRKKEAIDPGFLTLLDPAPATIKPVATAPQSTGRRTALASWLTRPDNPLSTRVVVNRIWQYHFGRGIVSTSSDFGRLGERPSHPELLDWLTTEFVARGWSFKQMHRLILTSATYRQSATHPDATVARRKDPENRLHWHRLTRRLDVEPIRDAMLAVSGELDLAIGGPAVDADQPRRTVYSQVKRNKRDPLGEAFDAPDGSITTPQRDATVTPIQALLMINGSWTLDRAKAFATRLQKDAGDDEARVELAYRLAFGRKPGPAEQAEALAFLHHQAQVAEPTPKPEVADGEGAGAACNKPGESRSAEVDPASWADFCHALLNASEFLYID
ncbi:Planctomycete cytochrome C [Singulisphaera sp. GP187]|uniref:PSD1 and planctomycete cytochrome C domain-containing protein n=1 Tax=Singulisphaera sp. GP187 TaxID=1882752 RepID=UPI000927CECA|nr:PSD1 and planctomycete cytochrome C domain-containing protein [Singulisphaera sp. GP187]SIO41147.1 Planctomycete cytochrome C [Singulisphaera sp. GP187]